ncbi:hypothetical protein WYI_17263, partial [Ochrobactrum sp. CDB2]
KKKTQRRSKQSQKNQKKNWVRKKKMPNQTQTTPQTLLPSYLLTKDYRQKLNPKFTKCLNGPG